MLSSRSIWFGLVEFGLDWFGLDFLKEDDEKRQALEQRSVRGCQRSDWSCERLCGSVWETKEVKKTSSERLEGEGSIYVNISRVRCREIPTESKWIELRSTTASKAAVTLFQGHSLERRSKFGPSSSIFGRHNLKKSGVMVSLKNST